MIRFDCLRCKRPTEVVDINKSDGLCDSCDPGPDFAPPPVSNPYGMTPCPFCGSGRVSMSEGKAYGSAPLYRVKCECGAKGPSRMDQVAAINKWNERFRSRA